MSGFCKDCPDHEACMQSYPCWWVKGMDKEAKERRQRDKA